MRARSLWEKMYAIGWFARDVTAAMLVIRNKGMSLLGTKLYCRVNSSRKNFIVLTLAWPLCHVVSKPRIEQFALFANNGKTL